MKKSNLRRGIGKSGRLLILFLCLTTLSLYIHNVYSLQWSLEVSKAWSHEESKLFLPIVLKRYPPPEPGTIIFATDISWTNTEIYRVKTDGTGLINLTNHPAVDEHPKWSPDGSKIVFDSNRNGEKDIYVMNSDGTGLARLTNDPAYDIDGSWSPDGNKIAFFSNRDGNNEIYVMNADGSGQINLSKNKASDISPFWSPDGSRIAFLSDRDGGDYDIYVMNTNGSNQINLSNNTAYDDGISWSPDGSKIAFDSSPEDSNTNIYTVNINGTGLTNISNHPADDLFPKWSPNGDKIAFWTNRNQVAAIYTMNPDGSEQTYLEDDARWTQAWSPDSTRIVFLRSYSCNLCDDIFVMNADGSEQEWVILVPGEFSIDGDLDWQPQP